MEEVMIEAQKSIERHRALIERQLKSFIRRSHPKPRFLAEPVEYVFGNRGKRIRPILVLLACEAVNGRGRDALPAGMAIELLHNFTLVHDDIMDGADSRRGRATVHVRWDQSTAILAGDELIALAYRALLETRSPRLRPIVESFTRAFVAVCEGQGYDKEFEVRHRVSLADYMKMIDQKTATIISAAAEIGGLIGGGRGMHIGALRAFGLHLGRAFQIQDDLLDVIGDAPQIGKPVGADIASSKKTYPLIRALERAKGVDRSLILRVINRNGARPPGVKRIRALYEEYGVLNDARKAVQRETEKAKRLLRPLPSRQGRAALSYFADQLMQRHS